MDCREIFALEIFLGTNERKKKTTLKTDLIAIPGISGCNLI